MSTAAAAEPRVDEPETADEWAARMLAERGLPPRHVIDKVRRIAKAASARPAP